MSRKRAPHWPGPIRCLCSACRRAAQRAAARRRPVPDHVHGTPGGQQNYGCTCDPCRQAATANRARWPTGYVPRPRVVRPSLTTLPTAPLIGARTR